MSSTSLHKLQKRIAVHDRYALAAALYVYTHKLFNKTDAICQKIASFYTMHPNAKINPMQMGMLKKRMPAYAPTIHKIQTDIPLRFIEAAKQCTYESMSNHVDNTNIGTASILGASNKSPYILLSFKFDPVIIEKLKKLESPKFDTATKKWKVKATISNAEYLLAMGFVFDQELLDWYHTYCYKFYPEPKSDVRIRGIKKQFLTFQKHGIAYVISRRNRALIGDEMGVGKAQPVNCVVCTPSGYKKLKECNVGDEIFGSDGKVYNIEGVYPQGVKDTYKITFSDKTYTYCCDEHLWAVTTPGDKCWKLQYHVWTLNELRHKKLTWSTGNTYFIPMTQPLQFKSIDNFLDPYLIGCLIGDGGLSSGISFSNKDEDILNSVSALLPEGVILRKCKGDNVDYNVVWEVKTTKQNPVNKEIKRLGLNTTSEHKYIPDCYKFSSIEDRIALLQGLCDTDAYATTSCAYFTSVSKQLIDDVRFIVESLGGRVTETEYESYYTKNNERIYCKIAYDLRITLPKTINPFRCERKRNKLSPKRFEPNRAIISIEKVESQECLCIQTSAPNSLYLTNNCIVTHNTIQAIGWLQYLAYERPCIIICPASLKYNWAKEIEAWVKNPTIYIISGSPDINDNHEQVYNDKYLYSSSGSKNIFIIINYDIISNDFEKCVNDEGKTVQYEIRNSKWVDYLRRLKIRCAVIDEAQYLKNKEAHRSMAILSLCKDIPNILALSGTPIDNRPIEFFNILNMLNPYQFPSKAEYAKRYCGAVHNGFGWDFSGSSNLKELHEIVSKSVMIRRLKEHVLSELPPKRRVIVDIELTNKADYIKAKTNVIDWLRNEGLTAQAISAERAEALAKINILLQLALKGKLKSCIEWIHTYLESGEKLVVFTTHRKTVEILMKEFGHFTQNKKGIAVEVDGSTPVKTRQKHVELFQENPKCKLFVGNIQAAGVGLTLTKAPDTCFVELGMVPGHHLQAEDRVHRIGQKASAVCAYYLIAKGTIEEDIARLLSSKYEVLKLALDGIEINESEQSKQQHSLLVDLVDTLQTLA